MASGGTRYTYKSPYVQTWCLRPIYDLHRSPITKHHLGKRRMSENRLYIRLLQNNRQKCAKIKWCWSQIRAQTAIRPYRRFDCQVRLFNIMLCHALDQTQLAWDASEMVNILQAAETLVKYLKKSDLAAVMSKQSSKWGTLGSVPSISLTTVSVWCIKSCVKSLKAMGKIGALTLYP